MGHERQIGVDWLSAHFTDKVAQEGQTRRGGLAAWWLRRAFDPVQGAGYEAAEASA